MNGGRFGGIPVQEQSGGRFGGIPVNDNSQNQLDGEQAAPKNIFQAVGGAALGAAKAGLQGVDWLSHLGQPGFAKKWVEQIRGNQNYAPDVMTESLAEHFKRSIQNDAKTTRMIAATGVDMATSPVSWLGAVAKIPGVSQLLESAAVKTAAGASKISPEALKLASVPEGRQALQVASGNTPYLANKVVQFGDNPRAYIPEHDAVRAAEAGAAPIDIRPTLQAFEDAKVPSRGPMGAQTALDRRVNARISTELDAMRGTLPTPQQIADMDFAGNLAEAKAALADPESRWGILKGIADKANSQASKAVARADRTAISASKAAGQYGSAPRQIPAPNEPELGGYYGAGSRGVLRGTAPNPALPDMLEKAKSAAAIAKEAAADAQAKLAVGDITQKDANAAKAALNAANKNLYVSDAANQFANGKTLDEVSRYMVDTHKLSGDQLAKTLLDARSRVGNNSFEPNYMLDAEDFRKLKTSLGKDIKWDEPEAKAYSSAMQKVYGKMKGQLVDAVAASQGPEAAAKYAADLDAYSTKIQDFQELNRKLGKDPSTRLNRAEALIKNHDKMGNTDLLSRIQEHTGEDIMTPAKLSKMAAEFGPEGKIPLLPSKDDLAKGAGAMVGSHYVPGPLGELLKVYGAYELGMGSPAIATRAVIPAARNAGKGLIGFGALGSSAKTLSDMGQK